EASKMRAYNLRSYIMTENTAPFLATDLLLTDNEQAWYPPRPKITKSKPAKFPPNEDIDLWLKHNKPRTFQQLADIRYVPYHRCSRADFTVENASGDQFDLIGRHSTLRIINDAARRYLLWKLRLLGRKRKWFRALPKT